MSTLLLIAGGVVFETVVGPGYLGWLFITLGFVVTLWFNRFSWYWPSAGWSIILLVLFSSLSLLVTTDFHTTFMQVDRLIVSLILYVTISGWAKKRSQIMIVSAGFASLGVALALAAPFIISWQTYKTGLIPNAVYDRLPQLLADTVHPNVMASLMLLIFPLPFALLLHLWQPTVSRLEKRLRWVAFVAALLIGGILILTRSRGGYIAGSAGIVVALWLARQRLFAVLLALIGAGGGVWLGVRGTQSEAVVANALADPSTFSFRLGVWKTAVDMLSDFPFTGVGMGTFNDVATRLYPFPVVSVLGTHNLYLQVAVDLGLIGLIGFLAILGLVSAQAWLAIRMTSRQDDKLLQTVIIGLSAGLVALLVHGLFDITVWGTRMAFVPWVLMGLITAVYQFTRQSLAEHKATKIP